MSFITKYRPQRYQDVLGQADAAKALESAVSGKRAQVFALSGPSGTGKTTLARIAAASVGCKPSDILEVDAATHTGIDKMREVQNMMLFRTVTGGPRAAIVDEAHRLSANAWDSLLKATEEPKAGALWFFCTTNIAKMPKTMITRCAKIDLKPVKDAQIRKLVEQVADDEKLKIGDGAIDAIISAAEGSPRQALSHLVVCADANTRKEAEALIASASDSASVIDLCRFMMKPGGMNTLSSIFADLKDENPEGVRIVVMNYFGKVAAGAKNADAFFRACDVLEAFCQPYNGSEGLGPLMVSVSRANVMK